MTRIPIVSLLLSETRYSHTPGENSQILTRRLVPTSPIPVFLNILKGDILSTGINSYPRPRNTSGSRVLAFRESDFRGTYWIKYNDLTSDIIMENTPNTTLKT